MTPDSTESKSARFFQKVLLELIRLHRLLGDAVREEREALVSADVKAIESHLQRKQEWINRIRQVEFDRKKRAGDLSWPEIVQSAGELLPAWNQLKTLVQEVLDQNNSNGRLLEKSIEHVQQMKKNILGKTIPKSAMYSQQGQKIAGHPLSPRFLSTEI